MRQNMIDIDKLKVEIVKRLKPLDPDKIILFGSYARDEQNEKSDIDFLVEFEKNRGNYDDFIKLQHFLEDIFLKKIDLVEPEYVREELKSNIFGGIQYEAKV
jgi:predicted nucleotidyltransferase